MFITAHVYTEIGKQMWLTLPVAPDMLAVIMDSLAGDAGYRITDSNSCFPIDEDDSITKVNEIALAIEESGIEYGIAETLFNAHVHSEFDEVLKIITDGNYTVYAGCDTMAEVARHKWLEHYKEDELEDFGISLDDIDWEKLGRNLEINGEYYGTMDDNSYVGVWR